MKFFLPAIICTIAIALLSTTAKVSMPESWDDLLAWDKVGHFTAYAVLVYVWLFGWHKQGVEMSAGKLLIVFTGSALYGTLMEYIQYSYFPGRYFEKLDILANIIGSFIGIILFKLFKP